MDTGKLTALLPQGAIRPWPAAAEHVPTDRDWHARREEGFPAGSVARYLYGDGGEGWPGAWDHPVNLVPGVGD